MNRKLVAFALSILLACSLALSPQAVSAGTSPGITITSPKSQDVVTIGALTTVNWTWDGDPGPLKFYLTDGNGVIKDYIVSNVRKPQANLAWKPRVQEYDWYARHKIVARTEAGNKFVAESAHFSIKPPDIAVTLAPGGAVWTARVSNKISWSPKTLSGSARIELVRRSDNQVVHVFASGVPFESGSQTWGLPALAPVNDGKEFFVRVWHTSMNTWGDSGIFKIDL